MGTRTSSPALSVAPRVAVRVPPGGEERLSGGFGVLGFMSRTYALPRCGPLSGHGLLVSA